MKKVDLTKSILIAVSLVLVIPQSAYSADSGGGSTPLPMATPTPITVKAAPTPLATPTPITVKATPTPTAEPVKAPTVITKTVIGELTRIREIIAAKDFKSARAALLISNGEFPNNADVNNLLGFTSRKLKMYGPAATYYTKALSINPSHLGALEYQGELFIETNKIALAKKNLAKLKTLCGINCEEYLDLKKALGNR